MSATEELGGSYEVIRRRLLDRVTELGKRAEQLDARRREVFGGSEMALAATERVRTENNCLPRDIAALGGSLLVGYDVFVGMKTEVLAPDIFALHRLVRDESGALTFEPFAVDAQTFLTDERFLKDFGDLFRYVREARIRQLRVTPTRLLAIFGTGASARDQKVFRWSIDAAGRLAYLDARGEDDNVRPRAHDFTWKLVGREQHVAGKHPHVSILDQVFVETIGGDLTIKVENNTASGQGIYSEPVDDANQSLDDAQIHYAQVGALILLKIKPYREERARHFIYNPRRRKVIRVDAIEHAAVALPEDHGVIFSNGYYLVSGESKVFDDDGPMTLERVVKSPNGEDVLYVFYREGDGTYVLHPYNLIRKEVAAAVSCHGYSLFDDGTLIVFRAAPGEEATRVHPLQVWRTPFFSAEHAAKAPRDGSHLAKVGNPDLVRGISEVYSLRRLAQTERPDRQTWEDLIAQAQRTQDAYHWLGHPECFDLLSVLKELRAVSEQIVDEFEKAEAVRRRAAEALAQAEGAQKELLRAAPDASKSASEYLDALTALRRQRGHLGTLRDLRAMDLTRVEALEKDVDARFVETSRAAAGFLSGDGALAPLLDDIAAAVKRVEAVKRTVELAPITADIERVHEGLTLLSETVAGLQVDDPTLRTKILDAVSEVFSQLNRARALTAARTKELRGAEGRAEFGAQVKVFAQAVQSALAVADSPEKCDQSLARLTVQVEELEGRFGEFDEFAAELAAKREELNDAFGARRQTLLDERQKRAGNLLAAAERILQGVLRRARTFTTADDLNAYFAGDPMVAKVRELSESLRALGDTVKADEVDGRVKSARQEGVRALRDRSELFDEGAANVIKFGPHRFFVNTQPMELSILPRDGGLALHLSGTDFFEPLEDPALLSAKDLWDQSLPSETPEIYRGEFLAALMLREAERGTAGFTLTQLREDALTDGGLLSRVRQFSAERHDEGYERGVHDVDTAHILDKLLALTHTAGVLRHEGHARALGVLYAARLDEPARALLARRCRSAWRIRAVTGAARAMGELADEITRSVAEAAEKLELTTTPDERVRAARYLVEELSGDRVRFALAGDAAALCAAFLQSLQEAGARSQFEDDLRALEPFPSARVALVMRWMEGFAGSDPKRAPFAREAAVALIIDRRIEREVISTALDGRVEGLLGQHPRIVDRVLPLRIDELLARADAFIDERLPRWKAYRKSRSEAAERERRRLRVDEFTPRVLSSFVRNKLVDEVYLPLVGANLAKQLGAAGDAKRTDLMGLLLLVSPPGYGKTTVMEYVAAKLGLAFMKVNGPALGHAVVSLDPAEAPNATARQEVEKINLALEMGNNVMLYLDDIQHTNAELLQKFISLCDGSRRVEGVWRGRTRTYDLRGKRFCIAMAGNPYTESGARFRIPDMLANRADTYNLGDILGGRDDAFALSYVENALTSNAALAPLGGRSPQDLYKLIRMAQGEAVPASELEHPYSAAEVGELVSVLKHLLQVQRTMLKVNAMYIASASQEDTYRTEPPFKLQGSYRNMNKVAEKVVGAHTPEEIEALLDDHYASESQTLTTGAEQNLLKLAEMRGRMSEAQTARWEEIRKEYARQKRSGGKEDDPVSRVTGTLTGIGEEIERVRDEIRGAAARSGDGAAKVVQALTPGMEKLHTALDALSRPVIEVQVPPPEASAEALFEKIQALGPAVGPLARAAQHGLGTLPGLLQSLVHTLDRLDQRLASGVIATASGAGASSAGAPVAATGGGAPREDGDGRGSMVPTQAQPTELPFAMPPLPDADPGTGLQRFGVELTATSTSVFFVPAGKNVDVLLHGGVFVQTYRRLPRVGEVVILVMRFAGGERFETAAAVNWVREAALNEPDPGFGARLYALTEPQAAVVRAYLNTRPPARLRT
jgi:hypothetical protein